MQQIGVSLTPAAWQGPADGKHSAHRLAGSAKPRGCPARLSQPIR